MTTVASELEITFAGKVVTTIIRVKFSLCSKILSLLMLTSNEEMVTPTGNVTLYGPER